MKQSHQLNNVCSNRNPESTVITVRSALTPVWQPSGHLNAEDSPSCREDRPPDTRDGQRARNGSVRSVHWLTTDQSLVGVALIDCIHSSLFVVDWQTVRWSRRPLDVATELTSQSRSSAADEHLVSVPCTVGTSRWLASAALVTV